MLAAINSTALPALRIAGTFFFIINLLGLAYIIRNRRRFFTKDPDVSGDIPSVRRLRVEVILIPWLALTTCLLVLLIYFWQSNTMIELVVTSKSVSFLTPIATVEFRRDDGVMVEVASARTYPMEMGKAVKPRVHY
jgi:hypothetical protein